MGDLQMEEGAVGPLSSRLNLPLRPGEILDGKYTVTRLIGAGSMGFVFSAARPSLGDEVAIKVLRKEMLSDGQLVARFAREARVAASIKSEHVACVFDVGHLVDGAPFIVMERLEGKDLRWVLAERGTLPTELAVDYILQVCEALAIAHANGITHRDIKPENLFASRQTQGDDVIKVLDFGISKMNLRSAAADKLPLVKTTMAMGSPMYMSPEQIRAAKDIDGRADIWALGCVLYELLVGNPPFTAPSVTELCAQVLECKPVSFESLGVIVSPQLEAVIWRCLEKDPNQRFQRVGELALALSSFAPSRALISVERCCHAQADEMFGEDPFEVATVPGFVPPRAPFNWARAALALVLSCVCCALLFSPHEERPSAMATGQTTFDMTPVPPADNVLPAPPRESEGIAAGPSGQAPTTRPAPTPQAATSKPVPAKSRSRQSTANREKEELDVGF
jgi:serine/threonine protein kinase